MCEEEQEIVRLRTNLRSNRSELLCRTRLGMHRSSLSQPFQNGSWRERNVVWKDARQKCYQSVCVSVCVSDLWLQTGGPPVVQHRPFICVLQVYVNTEDQGSCVIRHFLCEQTARYHSSTAKMMFYFILCLVFQYKYRNIPKSRYLLKYQNNGKIDQHHIGRYFSCFKHTVNALNF